MFELSLSRNTFSLCVICLAVTGDLVVFCAVVLLYDGRGHSYTPCILWEETINVCMYVQHTHTHSQTNRQTISTNNKLTMELLTTKYRRDEN